MKLGLPHFAETRPGEMPDAYFLDGARVTPISRIVEAAKAPLVSPVARLSPEARAQIQAVENALPALATVARVNRAHVAVAGIPPLPAAPTLDEAARVALREARERSRIIHEGMATLKETDHRG